MQRIVLLLLASLVLSCCKQKEVKQIEYLPAKCVCEGTGKYTMVMDAGMGNWSLFYQPVFQVLKAKTRVCLIDRPGYGMDSVTLITRDAKTIAVEIKTALERNGVKENIIFAGHSLGGLHALMFQYLFPAKVKGLILLDAASSSQFDRLPQQFGKMLETQKNSLEEVIALAKRGWLEYGKGNIPRFGMPDSLADRYYAVTTTPEYYITLKAEVEAFKVSLWQVDTMKANIQNLPLLVIASAASMNPEILPSGTDDYPYNKHNRIWLELQKNLAGLSQKSTLVISYKDHYLNITDASFVATSIQAFLDKHFRDMQE
jgi:pimeloyl-ACP methyl ester carboxylesterase